MLSKWQWLLLQFGRKLWVRASLFALLGVASALTALVVPPVLPVELPMALGVNAVDPVLNILASSMLAVTTFSLSVMVSAYGAASSSVSPRATRLLMQDSTTQTVLGTFVGSFLFSLVGIIALSTGAYGQSGRTILFAVTLVVILLVVIMLLRWIDHLSQLGRVSETIRRVEDATRKAMADRASNPNLGANPLAEDTRIPPDAAAVKSASTGYIQHLDMAALGRCADQHSVDIYVQSMPGAFVHPGRQLALVSGPVSDALCENLEAAFSIDDLRSFDQDPRFGLVVLAEIASRALSPAVNDSGTAIEIIGRSVRLLGEWARADAPEAVHYPRVWAPPLALDDLFDDIFSPIARDGAALVEVQVRLLKALAVLAELELPGYRHNAIRHAQRALASAEAVMPLDSDKARLRALVDAVDIATSPAH